MGKGLSPRKKEAAANFSAMFDDSVGEDAGKDGAKPTPEAIVVAVMHGAGDNVITERQYQAAKDLLGFRLPRLNTIDAHVATEEMSHEDWILGLEDEEDDE